jgi:hypothetical protein
MLFFINRVFTIILFVSFCGLQEGEQY